MAAVLFSFFARVGFEGFAVFDYWSDRSEVGDRRDFDSAFEQVDVIAGPVTPTPAFKIGEKTSDPLAMYLSDIYTISANLAGLPGVSIPCGFSSTKLPIGLQLLSPPFEEERLLRAARMFERESDWHLQAPSEPGQ